MKKIKNICKKFLVICGIFIYSFTSISVQTQASAVLITGVTFTLGEFVATLLGFSVVSGLSYQKINGSIALDKKALTPREVVVDPAGLTKLRMCKSVADLIRMGFTSKTARYYNEACVEYKSAVVQEIVACNERIKTLTRDVADEAIKQKIIAEEKAKFDDTLLEQTISKTRSEFKEAMLETVKKLDMRIDNNYVDKVTFDVSATNIGAYNSKQFCNTTHFRHNDLDTNNKLFNLFMSNVKKLGYEHVYFVSAKVVGSPIFWEWKEYFNNYSYASRDKYKICRLPNSCYIQLSDINICVATNSVLKTSIRNDAFTTSKEFKDITNASYINISCADDYVYFMPNFYVDDYVIGGSVGALDKSVALAYPVGHEGIDSVLENIQVLDTTYTLEDVKEVAISTTLPIRIPYDEVDVISDVVVGEHAIEATRDYVLDRDLFIENVGELDNTVIDEGVLEDDKVAGDNLGILNKIWVSVKAIPQSITDFFSAQPKTQLDFSPLQVSLANKFPFCVPFDLYNSFSSFICKPQIPKFEVNFDKGLVGSASFVIDFTPFSKLAAILRYFILVIFVTNLIKKTRELIGG